MKKTAMTIAAGALVFLLSSCGQAENPGDIRPHDMAGLVSMEPAASPQGEAASDEAETGSHREGHIDNDVLDSLAGEYEYSSDAGTGKLIIEKTSDGYDISDYESEASYRFLANSSNIETMEDNRIFIKYPEQVFADGEVVFSYYILEHDIEGIDVYYGKSASESVQLLYHAVRADERDVPVPPASSHPEMTAEELLDAFINGSVYAVDSADPASTFYITDLDMDSDEWDSYSIGEKVDLDNDGEDELILCGPYGGIYLDARENGVYAFAAGEGTGYMLSYTVFNGAAWIMYSNRMHAEYELFHMEKYEGADNLVAEIDFSREPVDGNNIESGMKWIWNGTEISAEEFENLASKICAAEVNTD
ncbi:MAG: hypothetical protein NC420_05800 [Eubacterium sp.]|nr:hypothetical protein [Eubacterium sp.]